MGMTMTQKILAAHAGLNSVKAGDLIEAKLDLVLGNDITTPVAITVFDKTGFNKIFDKDKIAIVLDHYTPCKDIKSAELCYQAREFAKRFNITHLYDVGNVGIEHALLPEKGLTAPGTADRLDALLRQLDMPLQLPAFDEETLISAMFMDKKFSGQVLRVIVLNQIGKCFIHPTDATFFRGMTNI